jgi:metallophosphoesterase superfamily enzyme
VVKLRPSAIIEIGDIPSNVSQEGSTTWRSSGLIEAKAGQTRSLVAKGNRDEGHHRIGGIKMMKYCGGGHGYVGGLHV